MKFRVFTRLNASGFNRLPLGKQFHVGRYQLEEKKEKKEKKDEKKETSQAHVIKNFRLHPETNWSEDEKVKLRKVWGNSINYVRFNPEVTKKEAETYDYNHPGYYVFFAFLAFIAIRRIYAKDQLVDEKPMHDVEVEKSFDFMGHQIQIAKGDITDDNSMAIVCTLDSHCHHPATTTGKKIFHAAGHHLDHWLHNFVEGNGQLNPGQDVLLAPAYGKLATRSILFTPAPKWEGFGKYELTRVNVARTVEAVLLKAQKHDVRSVAFAPLIDEKSDVPVDIQVEEMFSAVIGYCTQYPDSSVKRIRFVNLDERYQQHLSNLVNMEKPTVPFNPDSWLYLFQSYFHELQAQKAFKTSGN